MSHHVTIKTEIKDIEAVKSLCRENGWLFQWGKRTFTDPYNLNQPCDHAISFNRKTAMGMSGHWTTTEIGLVRIGGTNTFQIRADAMLLTPHRLGENASKFMQLYGVHKATLEAKKLGYLVQRSTLPNGTMRLAVTGNF